MDLRSFVSVYYDRTYLRRKNLLKYLFSVLQPITFIRDKILIARYFRRANPLFSINKELGFLKIDLDKQLTSECVLRARSTPRDLNKVQTKDYLVPLTSLSDYGVDSPEFKLASSPELLSSITEYLGMAPYLIDITLLWSPAAKTKVETFKGSQLFHRDGEDVSVAKVWILCEDVTVDNGPTVLIPSSKSDEISRELSYKQGSRVSVSEERSLIEESYQGDYLYATGEAGTTYFTDTVRLFHYGSRTKQQTDRLVLMFYYGTFFSQYVRPILGYRAGNRFPNRLLGNQSQLSKTQSLLLRSYKSKLV